MYKLILNEGHTYLLYSAFATHFLHHLLNHIADCKDDPDSYSHWADISGEMFVINKDFLMQVIHKTGETNECFCDDAEYYSECDFEDFAQRYFVDFLVWLKEKLRVEIRKDDLRSFITKWKTIATSANISSDFTDTEGPAWENSYYFEAQIWLNKDLDYKQLLRDAFEESVTGGPLRENFLVNEDGEDLFKFWAKDSR